MKNTLRLLASSLIVMLTMFAFLAAPASAAVKCPDEANPGKGIYCCGKTQTSVDFNCESNKNDTTGSLTITSLIVTIINFLAIGVGIAVVGGIVWGSLWYTTANGNAGQAQQGISIIINSVIGLVLFLFMWAMINFLVPGGVFN